MVTDPLPAGLLARLDYAASEANNTMPLPPGGALGERVRPLLAALEGGRAGPVRAAGEALLAGLASFYRVEAPPLLVLGARPHEVDGGVCVTQLFGDYEPATGQIRVFLRTAITGKVVRPRAFLCTLLHEFCHHLDVRFFGRRSSFHTRGFFGRVDGLYHRALGTPEAERRPLHWVPAGDVWRIDWPAMRRGGEGGRAGLGLGGLRARGRGRVRRG